MNKTAALWPLGEARDSFWHVFSFLGSQYLYDVESGALHRIDPVLAEVAGAFGAYSQSHIVDLLNDRFPSDEVEGAYHDIEQMLEAGLLTPIPVDGEADGLRAHCLTDEEKTGTSRDGSPDRPLKAICLHVSHACNLRCSYCFVANALSESGQSMSQPYHAGVLMSPEVGKQAVDFMIRESGRVRQLEVDFFGGEPLLNFDAVVQIADYATAAAERAHKRVHFSLTTNATGLTHEIIDYMDRMEFQVILSLDGRPGTHDRWRVFPDGSGSHASAVEGILAYLSRTSLRDYYVRGTYTRANLDFAEDVAYITRLGIDRISMEPVVASEASEWGIRLSDLPVVRREYETLVAYYRDEALGGRPFEFFHFNLGALNGQCHERRLVGCGAGCQYLAVTPVGELYPCHQFVGDEDFIFGDVWSGITKPEVARWFDRVGVREKIRCRKCWARYLCSGGCHAAAYRASGDIAGSDEVACGISRIRLEAALAAYALTSSTQ